VNVSNNIITYTAPIKADIPNQLGGKEEFKKALDEHELQSNNSTDQNVDKTNESVNTTNNEDQNSDKAEIKDTDNVTNQNPSEVAKKNTVEGDTTIDSNDVNDSNNLDNEITNVIKDIIDSLKRNIGKTSKESVGEGINTTSVSIDNIKSIINSLKQKTVKTSKISVDSDKTTDGMAQIQQLLESLSSMIQSINKTTVIKTPETELNFTNLVQLVGGGKLTPDSKKMLVNNLNEIVSLLKETKGNSDVSTQILSTLQKITTQVEGLQGELSLLKVPTPQIPSENIDKKSIKDNLVKMVMKQSTKTISENISKNAIVNSSDSKNDSKSSKNNSFEEKFLKNLLSGDKEDTKISKVVSFMNQFEPVKTLDTAKVQNTGLVINKNNIELDVIKSVKFMELNNIKDLTVKMNPKELGEITIKLTMDSGIMKASILAQNKDTYTLLNHNIQDISDRLKNMDIKIQSLDINVYEDSTFFSKDSSAKDSNSEQNNKSKTNNDSEEDDISIGNNYLIEDNQVNKFV